MTPTFEELLEGKPSKDADPQPEGQPNPPEGDAEQPAAAQAAVKEAATEPAPEEKPGEKQPEGAPPAPEPIPQDEVKVRAFQKTAEDERRKRQASEQVATELRQQLAEMDRYIKQQQGQQQAPAQPVKPEFLDPEAVNFLQGQFQSTLEQQNAAFQRQMIEQKVVTSQEMMRARYQDYDAAEATFAEAMAEDPSLQEKLYQHPFPAQFAYEKGKQIKAMKEIGDDPTAYRQKLKDEILAEIQAQQPAPQQQQLRQPTPAPAPPPSLAGVASASPRVATGYQGPTPLNELLSQPINKRF